MFKVIMEDLVKECQKIKTTCNNAEVCTGLVKKLDRYKDPFKGLNTDYTQALYLKRLGVYVEPETYVLGSRQTYVTDAATGFQKPVKETVTEQYVSVAKTITAVHNNTHLISSALKNSCGHSEDGRYETYFDGKHWKSRPLNHGNVVVIRLYGDDFEPGNPLGSRKGNYKMGCVYFQLESLPPYLMSRTDTMYLALCYHSDDVRNYGWDNILRPLVAELRKLQSDGLALNFDGTTALVKVVVSGVVGDNLFLNGILGFVECFTAAHPCRHCMLPRTEFQTSFTEKSESLRTIEQYEEAVQTISVTDTGIKLRCALNTLDHFHAAENYIQDIMHDVFEGICAYDMPLICCRLIQMGHFDLSTLNNRLQSFSYGAHDKSNKPPFITSLAVEMFTFDACQLWCLTRVLSLAIGDLVDETQDIWQFYLRLRCIIDLLLAPSVTDDDIQLLSVLVAEYLEQRSELFPDKHLKNKHHHLIHYPRLIKMVGPLVRFWCMRFESKHQRNKRVLHITGNFKNILKTCAVRHQQYIAYQLLRNYKFRLYSDMGITVGPGSTVLLSELLEGRDINKCLGNVGLSFELYSANWVEVNGVKYAPSMYLLIAVTSSKPVFMHVEYIFLRNHGEIVWICGEQLVTKYFNTRYHAWVVEKDFPKQLTQVSPCDLIHYRPLTVVVVGDDRLSVIGVHHRI
jgi:hypothetical protein